MSCDHLTISTSNFIENATLTTTPVSVTSVDYLKDSFAARRTKWIDLEGEIVIEGVLDQPQYATYFAIPGTNLRNRAHVRLKLFTATADTVPILDTGYTSIGDMIPLGLWQAGIDEFDGVSNRLNEVITFWFNELIAVERFELTINHDYDYVPVETITPEPTVTVTTISDGIHYQAGNGQMNIEVELREIAAAGLDTWSVETDGDASNSEYLSKTESVFYWNHNEGPRITIPFTASISGEYDIWIRVKTDVDASSLYFLFDGHSVTVQMPTTYSSWTWHLARTVTTTAQQLHVMAIAARDYGMEIDKVHVREAGAGTPAGTGNLDYGFGTKTVTTVDNAGTTTVYTAEPTDSVEVRMLMMGNTMQTERNFSLGSNIRFMTDPDLRYTHSGRAVIARAQRAARKVSLSLPMMSDLDRLRLWRLEGELAGKPFLVSAFPDKPEWYAGNYTFLARFSKALDYTQKQDKLHSTTLDMVEV